MEDMTHPMTRVRVTKDARRSIGTAVAVIGLALISIGIAASPAGVLDQLGRSSLGLVLLATSGPVFGAAAVGYGLARDLARDQAMRSTLAYGAAALLLIVATFTFAALVRAAVGVVTDLAGIETGVVAGGLLIAFLGAFEWDRGAGGWRFAALGLLGWFLFVGWIMSAAGGAWDAAWQDAPLSSGGAACLALAVSGRRLGQRASVVDA